MNNKRPGKGKTFSCGKNSRLPIDVNVTRNLSNDWFMGCGSSNDAKRCHQWISKEESGPIWLLRESLFSLGPLHMSPFHRGFICEISAWFPRWEGRRRVVVRNSGNKANMVKHKVITFAPVTALETLKAVSLLSNGMLMMKKIQRQSKTMQNSFEELIPVTGLNCWNGRISSPLAKIPAGKTEISATEPARPLIWTHPRFYKGFRGKVRSRKPGQHMWRGPLEHFQKGRRGGFMWTNYLPRGSCIVTIFEKC